MASTAGASFSVTMTGQEGDGQRRPVVIMLSPRRRLWWSTVCLLAVVMACATGGSPPRATRIPGTVVLPDACSEALDPTRQPVLTLASQASHLSVAPGNIVTSMRVSGRVCWLNGPPTRERKRAPRCRVVLEVGGVAPADTPRASGDCADMFPSCDAQTETGAWSTDFYLPLDSKYLTYDTPQYVAPAGDGDDAAASAVDGPGTWFIVSVVTGHSAGVPLTDAARLCIYGGGITLGVEPLELSRPASPSGLSSEAAVDWFEVALPSRFGFFPTAPSYLYRCLFWLAPSNSSSGSTRPLLTAPRNASVGSLLDSIGGPPLLYEDTRALVVDSPQRLPHSTLSCRVPRDALLPPPQPAAASGQESVDVLVGVSVLVRNDSWYFAANQTELASWVPVSVFPGGANLSRVLLDDAGCVFTQDREVLRHGFGHSLPGNPPRPTWVRLRCPTSGVARQLASDALPVDVSAACRVEYGVAAAAAHALGGAWLVARTRPGTLAAPPDDGDDEDVVLSCLVEPLHISDRVVVSLSVDGGPSWPLEYVTSVRPSVVNLPWLGLLAMAGLLLLPSLCTLGLVAALSQHVAPTFYHKARDGPASAQFVRRRTTEQEKTSAGLDPIVEEKASPTDEQPPGGCADALQSEEQMQREAAALYGPPASHGRCSGALWLWVMASSSGSGRRALRNGVLFGEGDGMPGMRHLLFIYVVPVQIAWVSLAFEAGAPATGTASLLLAFVYWLGTCACCWPPGRRGSSPALLCSLTLAALVYGVVVGATSDDPSQKFLEGVRWLSVAESACLVGLLVWSQVAAWREFVPRYCIPCSRWSNVRADDTACCLDSRWRHPATFDADAAVCSNWRQASGGRPTVWCSRCDCAVDVGDLEWWFRQFVDVQQPELVPSTCELVPSCCPAMDARAAERVTTMLSLLRLRASWRVQVAEERRQSEEWARRQDEDWNRRVEQERLAVPI